MLLDQRRN